MDTLRFVGGVVVAYLGFVLVMGSFSLVSDAVPAITSFVAANATHPIVLLNLGLVGATALIVALAWRKQ
ncbi:hypothetical protein [Halococcus thailandensis]|uniref:Uncharacterized protein n=1 Tax=Halococcus thailandensis JCM 13552 TaxID=1227457 RepID=M0N5L9_9EURY|nr:hypothetical protein [Halococcus thailandensis]EMA52853.1 hypothetical protein C451_10540 [Halococcus thailandensis JCM 13552]